MTNLVAIVLITLITNRVASSTPNRDERIETHIVSQRHVIGYTNGAQSFLVTNDYQVAVERRKFVAVRTEKWVEVPMPASATPVLPAGTNNFGSVNQ